jgi:porphyrinogen peroxidase
MSNVQPGILAPVPVVARYLLFSLTDGGNPRRALQALREMADGDATVAGIGELSIRAMGCELAGLREFPQYSVGGVEMPSTPWALWCWLRGTDRGELVLRSRQIIRCVAPELTVAHAIDAFRYRTGMDLTGFEDGTANPKDEAAVAAAVVSGCGPGLDGSSFVAMQQWVHDFERYEAMSSAEQDDMIGRHKIGNEEMSDAPASAHIKRTEQESFEPFGFVLRRSMPWADGQRAGLVFVAFGKSLDAYEAQLRRMAGAEDGVTDALFLFTRPISGGYFWCPPVVNGCLDLSALGL